MSERGPGIKTIGLVAAKPRELQTTKDRKVEFFVCACFDVFFEELSFGNRRQLAKLESIGRLFRVVIDQKFGVAPFLRLNLTWNPSTIHISSQLILSDTVLPEPPSFLRFNVVSVKYRAGLQPIATKCESVIKFLLPLKSTSALNGAKLEFDGRIDRNDLCDFSDHQMLLAHIGNDLLPICNVFHAYEFHLSFMSEQSAPIVISSILGMEPARDCANVKFVILGIYQPTPLPLESITNWFFHNVSEDRKRKIREKKSLDIRMDGISNGAEIQACLKEANYGNRHKEFSVEVAFSFGYLSIVDQIKSLEDQIKSIRDENKSLEDQIKSIHDENTSIQD